MTERLSLPNLNKKHLEISIKNTLGKIHNSNLVSITLPICLNTSRILGRIWPFRLSNHLKDSTCSSQIAGLVKTSAPLLLRWHRKSSKKHSRM